MNKKRLKIYLLAGAVYLLMRLISDLANYAATFPQRAVNNVWLLAYVVPLNYFFFEYALPFFGLSWKRLLKGLVILLVFLMLYSFGLYAWRMAGIEAGIYTGLMPGAATEKQVEQVFAYSVGAIFLTGIIRHIYNYRKLKIAAQQLRIEKQEAELNYLKSQTNPHFLFNTLNNIYSLALDKSPLAPESIMRLSKILRFMLYEAGGAWIAIEEEMKIMNDYIALEQLRYDDSLRIHFSRDVEDMKQAIPPLLLIPLVENAFKHGASETRERPFVDIHLSVNRRQLTFTVKNSAETPAAGTGVKEQIGLTNLRRQLELLYTHYSLNVQHGNGVFTTVLKINLASHVSH